MDKENLSAADRIVNALLNYSDHMVHNRPGMIVESNDQVGVTWYPVTHKTENGQKTVFKLEKLGKKTKPVEVGKLSDGSQEIKNGTRKVGTYQPAGLFPNIAAWMYRQVASVWQLDKEFSARWASYAFAQEHRDLKVVLAAFMLVQSKKGDPIVENGVKVFDDDDFRDVGEAMVLLTRKDGRDFNPKLLLRIHEFLSLPEIVKINHELGFGQSNRKPFYGRWEKAVHKYLRYREENRKMLDGLVKAGFRESIVKLVRISGYKPTSEHFFQALRWKQSQAKQGHRTIAIGKELKAAETWEGLTERQICQAIVKDRPGFKRIVGMLPKKIGLTRAVMSAAIESGSLSDKDLIIYTPTLEDLGLLADPDVKKRYDAALAKAEDSRAANIASRVRSKDVKDKLNEAADTAIKKAVAEVMRNMRVYVMVDISGSMESSLAAAKEYVAKFLQGFPKESVHVAVFNTAGREVQIKHASAAGVAQAFDNFRASGGTDYGSGVVALQKYKPNADEDALFIFIGDEEAQPFTQAVWMSGLNPLAFGFLKTTALTGAAGWRARTHGQDHNIAVRHTAAELGIPCFMIDEATFADPYAIPRTIRALIAATPVNQKVVRETVKRETLADVIVKTELLQKPAWAV